MNLQKNGSTALIEKGKQFYFWKVVPKFPAFSDLGSSPLLLSIVCALYYNDLNVPSEPTELYSRSVEGILGGWDNFRNIARESPLSSLTIHKKMMLASTLAANLFSEGFLVFSHQDVDECEFLQKLADVSELSCRIRKQSCEV